VKPAASCREGVEHRMAQKGGPPVAGEDISPSILRSDLPVLNRAVRTAIQELVEDAVASQEATAGVRASAAATQAGSSADPSS
jgi:hypothetical protein